MVIRIGVVGCGAIAEAMHVPAAMNLPEVSLTAAIDSDIVRARLLADQIGSAQAGPNMAEFASELDAVILATPPDIRPQLAEQAFGLGLHVLCEKPLANSVHGCDQIIQAAERANRTLAVAHIFRFWPSRLAMRDIIVKREFGAIKSAIVTQGNPYSWSSATGYNMRREMVPGGVLFDAGIHPLDAILWWFGDPEILDYQDDSLGGLESNVRLTMSFEDVPEVRFRQSRTAPMANEFRIEAEHATITLSNYSATTIQIERNGGVETRQVAEPEVNHLICERNQLANFVDSITQSSPAAVTGADARRVIELVERCYQRREPRIVPEKAPLPGHTF